MANTTAEALAAEIVANSYTPSAFPACAIDLPIDRNPNSVQFIQPLLIAPAGDAAGAALYRILTPATPPDPAAVARYARALAKLILELRAKREPGRRPRLARDTALAILQPLIQAGLVSHAKLAGHKNLEDLLTAALIEALTPGPFQPFANPHPEIALCAVFEQVWEHRGYTRGEVITNLSLAPGEQVTLEIHSWDKTTVKNEEELYSESEMRVSESLTERDSHTVVRELSRQHGSSFNGGVSGMIPKTPITVSAGGSVSSSVSRRVTDTMESTAEQTVSASETLKNTRKLRIEVAREIGREQKQTRVVSNTNRCHTLNCLYFEVVANYVVTTRFVRVQPCLALPNIPAQITPAWVLCHEDILKQVLLSKTFLPGFDAARMLETQGRLEPDDDDDDAPALVPDIIIDDLIQDFDDLIKDVGWIHEIIDDIVVRLPGPEFPTVWGDLPLVVAIATTVGTDGLLALRDIALLAHSPALVAALQRLTTDRADMPAAGRLARFTAGLAASASHPDAAGTVAVAAGLARLGIAPSVGQALMAWNLLDVASPVSALSGSIAVALQHAAPAPPATGALVVRSTAASSAPAEGYSKLELARAKVNFAQLECHIRDNWLHYNQAVWARENPGQRYERFARLLPGVASFIANEIVGFIGSKSAFPILDRAALDQAMPDLAKEIEAAEQALRDAENKPRLVTMPTAAHVVEAIIGECDACEDFIRESRVLDLQTQKAKADQETFKAERLRKRLDQSPPLLDDPNAVSSGVTINVDGTPTNNG